MILKNMIVRGLVALIEAGKDTSPATISNPAREIDEIQPGRLTTRNF